MKHRHTAAPAPATQDIAQAKDFGLTSSGTEQRRGIKNDPTGLAEIACEMIQYIHGNEAGDGVGPCCGRSAGNREAGFVAAKFSGEVFHAFRCDAGGCGDAVKAVWL